MAKVHDVGLETCVVRLPAVTAICMKRDLPNRQFAQDMLKINVEKDYAIHSIQRQEAVFRRRYCHLISRVENMGKTNAYKGRRPPTTLSTQVRRNSDPCSSSKNAQFTTQSSRKILRSRTASLPDLRRSSMTTPKVKVTEDRAELLKNMKTSSKSLLKKTSERVDELSCHGLSTSGKCSTPRTVSTSTTVSQATPVANEAATQSDPKLTGVGAGEASTLPFEESKDDDHKSDNNIREFNVDEDDDKSMYKNVQTPSLWSKTTHNNVFVDYGPTTIDKIFNVLFDHEPDHTAESSNDNDKLDVKSEKRYDRTQRDDSLNRKSSLKISQMHNLVYGMRQTETRRDCNFGVKKNIDNGTETLKKCRYLRLPARRYRDENDTDDEKVTTWRY